MIPTLTAVFLRTRVPRYSERLETTARKLDEVLLQRRDAEGVADLIVAERPVGAVGPNPELAILLVKGAGDVVFGESGVVETTKYGLLGRHLHGHGMLRT